jgi:hypothetical protein
MASTNGALIVAVRHGLRKFSSRRHCSIALVNGAVLALGHYGLEQQLYRAPGGYRGLIPSPSTRTRNQKHNRIPRTIYHTTTKDAHSATARYPPPHNNSITASQLPKMSQPAPQQGMKRCSRCGDTRPMSDFKREGRADYKICPDCRARNVCANHSL